MRAQLSIYEHEFWPKVSRGNGCWEWRGAKTTAGYGLIHRRRDGVHAYFYAHRLAYEFAVGPIAAGLLICHRCDNPPCCRPDHLFAGTNAANQADMATKGRWSLNGRPNQRYGERVHNAVLTDAKVLEIYAARRTGMRGITISRQLGIDHATVYKILSGKAWPHLYHLF